MPIKILKRLKMLMFIAVSMPLMSSCYVPVRFDAEIELDRRGYYSMIFDGYLADLGLYTALRDGKASGEDERAKVKLLKTDITRDSAVKEFTYFKKGHFKVHWEKRGDLLKAKMVTFLRRSEKFVNLKYIKKKGIAVMEGASVAKTTAKQLDKIGLGIQGEIRVITSLRVLSHNATKVKGDPGGRGKKVLTWKINSAFDPTPNMVVALR